MDIELTWEQKSEVVVCVLKEEIDTFEHMILNNYAYHFADKGSFAPLYSWDYKEEDKKLNKMLKRLIKIHNYYSLEKIEEIL